MPDANLPYRYAAEAYVGLERWPEAIKSFERYLALKPDVSDAEEVRARVAELRAKYVEATLRLTSDPERADVFVDGSATAALATPATLTLKPGRHHFVFRAPAHMETALDLDVVGGQASDARVTLAPEAAPVTPPPARSAPLRTIGWITVGAGGAAIVTAALLDTIVLGKTIDDFRAAAAAGDPSAEDKKRSADTQRLVYGITYAVGGALVVTGVVLLLLPQRSKVQANAGGFV